MKNKFFRVSNTEVLPSGKYGFQPKRTLFCPLPLRAAAISASFPHFFVFPPCKWLAISCGGNSKKHQKILPEFHAVFIHRFLNYSKANFYCPTKGHKFYFYFRKTLKFPQQYIIISDILSTNAR